MSEGLPPFCDRFLVIDKEIKYRDLEEILSEYRKLVAIDDDMLGKFKPDKDDKSTWDNAIATMRTFMID